MKLKQILLFAVILLNGCTEKEQFAISSGSPGAIYYPTAKALCKNFNRQDPDYKCNVLQSSGAANNIKGVQNREFAFGISQFTLLQEYQNNGNAKNVKPVMGLHHEHFSIAVAQDSGVKSFDDLKGKRVNIGNPGSGSRIYFEKLMQAKGWSLDDFAAIYEKKSSYLDDLICQQKIDAAIYLVGHPNQVFSNIINKCGGRILSLSKNDKSFLYKNLDGFKDTIIPALTYVKQEGNVDTIGIPIILATRDDVDFEIIDRIKEYSLENRSYLEKQHAIFKQIDFSLPLEDK